MKKWPQALNALVALGTHLPADPVGRRLRRPGRRSRYFPSECANDRGNQRVNLRMLRELKQKRSVKSDD